MLTAILASLAISSVEPPQCSLEWIVLGAAQDAGAPQIGNPDDPAWNDPSLRMFATSGALVDHDQSRRYLFEATPMITEQLNLLNRLAPMDKAGLGLDGIFITHAHMGHYGGLMFLGFEAANADAIPVYAMTRLKAYFETNGPWDQLVKYDNIALHEVFEREPKVLDPDYSVTPYQVPHRDEYSEVASFIVETAGKDVLFLPDIDHWHEWEDEFGIRVEDMIERSDLAFIDATFFDDDELPGRDMSEIPHPRVRFTMDRFDESLAPEHRAKINFVHLNHTNPVRFVDSPESQHVAARGYNVARRGDRHCLIDR
jgi:pyrroloquinoline quinone biosynthesis protein B